MSVYIRYRKLPMKFWRRGINTHADPVLMELATHFAAAAQALARAREQWGEDELVNVKVHPQGDKVASYFDGERKKSHE